MKEGKAESVKELVALWERLAKPSSVLDKTECGRAELCFEAQGGRTEDLNLGLISSNFQQLYGHWSGTLRHGTETLSFEGVMGLGEDHECHW